MIGEIKPNRAQRYELYGTLLSGENVTKGVIEERIRHKFSTDGQMNHEGYRNIYLLTQLWGEKPFDASLDEFFGQDLWDLPTVELWRFLSKLFINKNA